MTIASAVRWATAADDDALRRLCRRTPIHGPISYCLEREPEFFALTRLQGDDGGRIAVVDDGHEIAAMAMMAPHRAWIAGEERLTAYLGDLKVDPDRRNEGLAGRVIDFLQVELDRIGVERSYFLVLAGNPAFDRVNTGAEHFRARKMRSIRNYLVPFAGYRLLGGSSDVEISPATVRDYADMTALWNRLNRRRNFAPVADEKRFARGEFLVARRAGLLAGFCATWNTAALKQVRLLRLSTTLRAATMLYSIAARLLRKTAFPRPGQCLRFLYVSQMCVDDPRVFESLLNAVYERHREEGFIYFDLALDHADPVAAAMERFRSMKLEFDLWEAITPAHAGAPDVNSYDPAYFDMSIV